MAGGHHGSYKPDPAVENFNLWREQNYLRFRWTPANVRAAILGVVVFPTALYTVVNLTTSRWFWNAKLKDQPLAGKPE
ncbi:hypothetical protein F5878DRAFT_656496 [Lentinula raphanica]|uniref:NADH dehydrogenase [ubiquinone] 1 beta subcomplex subunit 4 n=1 Tax=Lentinula raphanica TaxID=153919 RepID=A0AA38UJ73_9AGAR|nr:hypothetical protein F5878DRAFT_656496 [Lentinula raphanica]